MLQGDDGFMAAAMATNGAAFIKMDPELKTVEVAEACVLVRTCGSRCAHASVRTHPLSGCFRAQLATVADKQW